MKRAGSVRPIEQALRADTNPYWVAGPLAVIIACGSLGVALAPQLLLKQPLLLIALSPLIRHLFLASPSIDFSSFFLVAVVRLFAPDPFVYLLGRRYGESAVRWLEQRSALTGRMARGLEALFLRAWVLAVFVSPGFTVCTLAGAARIPFWRFALVNLMGTVAMVSVVRFAAHAAKSWITAFVQIIEDHLATFTVVSVALALGGYLVWRRGARPDRR